MVWTFDGVVCVKSVHQWCGGVVLCLMGREWVGEGESTLKALLRVPLSSKVPLLLLCRVRTICSQLALSLLLLRFCPQLGNYGR